MTNRKTLTILCMFSCALTTAAAHAQPTTDKLNINLTGYILTMHRCGDIKSITVVLDGNENDNFPAKPIEGEECEWTATRKTGTFNARTAHFSLRLGIGRTGCKQPNIYQTPPRLTFSCCSTERAQTVGLEVFPKHIPFSYLRRVDRTSDTTECVEHSSFNGSGVVEIVDVQSSSERLVLQLGFAEANTNSLGTAISYGPIEKHAKKNGSTLRLDSGGFIDLRSSERGEGASSAPNTSPLAIDIDAQKLAELKFERLDFTVK